MLFLFIFKILMCLYNVLIYLYINCIKKKKEKKNIFILLYFKNVIN